MRNLADVRSWFAQPMTGTAETLAAPYWRLLGKMAPQARIVIVRRPAPECVDSVMRIQTFGAGVFDEVELTRALRLLTRKLRQAEARLPNVLAVDFADLAREETCAAIFEHCLPYKHDTGWWQLLAPIDVNCEIHATMRYAHAFAPQLKKLGEIAAHEMHANLSGRQWQAPAGMSFQEETFAEWRADGRELFEKHCVEVDESPLDHWGKNWDLMERCAEAGDLHIVTARSNGRMFGYLMTIIAPSMEQAGRRSAIQTAFFADRCAPGTGLKLQRFAIERLKAHGADEVFFRAGPRGSGPKMGHLYQRLGAQPDGGLYRLIFEGN